MHIKLRLLFIMMFCSMSGDAQTYYPLAANRNVLNGVFKGKEIDSGLVILTCELKTKQGTFVLDSSKLFTRQINVLTNAIQQTEIVWPNSARAGYTTQILKLNDGTYLTLASVPIATESIDFYATTTQKVEPWFLHLDSNYNLISAKYCTDLGTMAIGDASLGVLGNDRFVMSVSSTTQGTDLFAIETSTLNLISTKSISTYFPVGSWNIVAPNKYICFNHLGLSFTCDSNLNFSPVVDTKVLPGYLTLRHMAAFAKYANMPIYNVVLDSANTAKQFISIFAYDTTRADNTRLLYKEESQTQLFINRVVYNVSVLDSAIYFGSNFTTCPITSFSNPCTNEQVIRKVRNGNLIWMKTLGGEAGYLLDQVIATKHGIWVICRRNKFGENIDQFDTYYALLDTNGNDIGPVIPFTTKINEQSKKESISLSPNPATSVVNITTTFTSNYHLTITNQLGQIMHEAKNASNKIDVSKYAPGLYRFAVQHQGKNYVQMVVKQ
jgi:hypothetical protein